VSFKPGPNEESAVLLKMEACAKEIYAWMECNKLKLYHDRTEFLVIHVKHARAHQYETSKYSWRYGTSN